MRCGRATSKIRIDLEEGTVPAKNAKGWKVEGEKVESLEKGARD